MHGNIIRNLLLAGLALAVAAPVASAGKPPMIETVAEARNAEDGNLLLVLTGRGLKKVEGGELFDQEGGSAGTLGVVKPGNTILAMSLPAGLEPGIYDVVLFHGRNGEEQTEAFEVAIRAGGILPGSIDADALQTDLRADLDDAESLSGNEGSFYQDATNVNAGTLSTDRFDAFEDLQDEGMVDGDGLWSTDHFSALDDLKDDGIFDMSDLLSTDNFSAWADLQAEGRVSGGLLSTSAFSAYDDLVAESKIGTGSTQVAAGDHDHGNIFLPLSGGTLTGQLLFSITGDPGEPYLDVDGSVTGHRLVEITNRTSGNGMGMLVRTNGSHASDATQAVALEAHHAATSGVGYGLRATTNSPDGTAVVASATGASGSQSGVLALAEAASSLALFAVNSGGGTAVLVKTTTSSGDAGGTAMVVNHEGSSGEIVEFQASAVNVARIDRSGKGYFNGGTATSGADFAESVRARGGRAAFEPGDVIVIDPEAERGFARSSDPCSSLLAGVVSTKPALLGSHHDVANGAIPDDEIAMGVVGIVPTKVCDENGPVRPGDLLVTASRPGYAMKASRRPAPGTVLGKALGRLDEGRGLVEVLLGIF